MALKEPKQKEVEEAIKYLEDLRKDPQKFEKWVDRVMIGWLKKKSSHRRLKTSKKRR
jgi:hypothetical protein